MHASSSKGWYYLQSSIKHQHTCLTVSLWCTEIIARKFKFHIIIEKNFDNYQLVSDSWWNPFTENCVVLPNFSFHKPGFPLFLMQISVKLWHFVHYWWILRVVSPLFSDLRFRTSVGVLFQTWRPSCVLGFEACQLNFQQNTHAFHEWWKDTTKKAILRITSYVKH